jgi:hypothetical protein
MFSADGSVWACVPTDVIVCTCTNFWVKLITIITYTCAVKNVWPDVVVTVEW